MLNEWKTKKKPKTRKMEWVDRIKMWFRECKWMQAKRRTNRKNCVHLHKREYDCECEYKCEWWMRMSVIIVTYDPLLEKHIEYFVINASHQIQNRIYQHQEYSPSSLLFCLCVVLSVALHSTKYRLYSLCVSFTAQMHFHLISDRV